jgi:hypothetical protein
LTIGNSAHQDSCRYASRNLPDAPLYLGDSDDESSGDEDSDEEDMFDDDSDDENSDEEDLDDSGDYS